MRSVARGRTTLIMSVVWEVWMRWFLGAALVMGAAERGAGAVP